MTASSAQLAANRANAAHSTGPRSDDGKATASLNALDHGVYATDQTLAAEPRSPLATLVETFAAEFDPQSPTEAFLDRLAAALDALASLGRTPLPRRVPPGGLRRRRPLRHPQPWAAALRRYDGSDAAYPRDPDPLLDPDPAQATLRQLLALQAARRGPAPDPIPPLHSRQHRQQPSWRPWRAALPGDERGAASRRLDPLTHRSGCPCHRVPAAVGALRSGSTSAAPYFHTSRRPGITAAPPPHREQTWYPHTHTICSHFGTPGGR